MLSGHLLFMTTLLNWYYVLPFRPVFTDGPARARFLLHEHPDMKNFLSRTVWRAAATACLSDGVDGIGVHYRQAAGTFGSQHVSVDSLFPMLYGWRGVDSGVHLARVPNDTHQM